MTPARVLAIISAALTVAMLAAWVLAMGARP